MSEIEGIILATMTTIALFVGLAWAEIHEEKSPGPRG